MKKITDLNSVKAMARMFVMLEVHQTKYSPIVVKHPFTDSGIVAYRNNSGDIVQSDITVDTQALKEWRRHIIELINESRSVSDITAMITKSYSLGFLKYIMDSLSVADMSEILSDMWVRTEAPNADPNMRKSDLLRAFRNSDPQYLMNEDEYEIFIALKDEVNVYRGVTSHNADNIKALSWTLNPKTAEWFAHRFDEDGTVYEARINRKHIYAYFNRRGEDEVIVDPKYLEDIVPLNNNKNIKEGDEMNEFRRLEELAKQYKALYPPGTRIEMLMMGSDPRPIEPGTRGTVDHIDDLGTIHCVFDNNRRLGIIPEEDSFRTLTEDELLDERSERLQREFIDRVNKEVIPSIGWYGIKKAYETGDMTVPIDLLRMLHENYLEVYGTNHLDSSDGITTVPGVVLAADGNLYVALLDIDACSSGEHWGTTFFTPNGVLSDSSEDDEVLGEIRKLVPYKYWYTVELETDHHVDWDECPEKVENMIDAATAQSPANEVRLE